MATCTVHMHIRVRIIHVQPSPKQRDINSYTARWSHRKQVISMSPL